MEPRTLKEAKEWLRARVHEGARCPCCTQMAKVYKRKIYGKMAAALIKFYHATKPNFDFVHYNALGSGLVRSTVSGDFAKMVYWGLIEEKPNSDPKDEDKRTSGFWRITQDGVAFVTAGLLVPKYAFIFDSRLMKFDKTEMVSIQDCLGEKFSYEELMAA